MKTTKKPYTAKEAKVDMKRNSEFQREEAFQQLERAVQTIRRFADDAERQIKVTREDNGNVGLLASIVLNELAGGFSNAQHNISLAFKFNLESRENEIMAAGLPTEEK